MSNCVDQGICHAIGACSGECRLTDLNEPTSVGAWAERTRVDRFDLLERALRTLAEQHHGTITGSRLHDPKNRDWTECECRSCVMVQEALATSRGAVERCGYARTGDPLHACSCGRCHSQRGGPYEPARNSHTRG